MEKNRSQLRRLDFVAESQPATEGIGAAGSQTKPALRRLLAGRLRKHDLKNQQPRSHHNGAVGHIEGRLLVRAYIEEEKIDHVPAGEAVP